MINPWGLVVKKEAEKFRFSVVSERGIEPSTSGDIMICPGQDIKCYQYQSYLNLLLEYMHQQNSLNTVQSREQRLYAMRIVG